MEDNFKFKLYNREIIFSGTRINKDEFKVTWENESLIISNEDAKDGLDSGLWVLIKS